MHPVIAISGIPGAGKTRASTCLAQALGAAHLSFDAYETMTAQDPDAVRGWLGRGAPVAEMFDPALDGVLAGLAAKGPVVFDTPLGRFPAGQGRIITCAVWIEVPRDVALARKLATQMAGGGFDSADALAGWTLGFLEAYAGLVLPCLDLQAARIKPLCDHVVDGMQPPEALDLQILALARQAILQGGAGLGLAEKAESRT